MKSRDDLELEAQEQIEASLKKGEIDEDQAKVLDGELKNLVEVTKDGQQMLVHVTAVAAHIKVGWKAGPDWVPSDEDKKLLGLK